MEMNGIEEEGSSHEEPQKYSQEACFQKHCSPSPCSVRARSDHPTHRATCSSPHRLSLGLCFSRALSLLVSCHGSVCACSALCLSLPLALFPLVFLSVCSCPLCLTPTLLLPFQNMTWSPVKSPRSLPTASGRACSLA